MGGCSSLSPVTLLLLLLHYTVWSFLILGTHQLQSSQTQVLLQLRKHLEYPQQLEIWNVHGVDFCSLPPSPSVNLTCQNNLVTELKLVGDKSPKITHFDGFAIPGATLSQNFSLDSFVTTLTRLSSSLRVLHLISLGIWGPLPDKIHRLSSLEYIDLSSNFLYGTIPPKISTMVKLQDLVLDSNFFNGTVPSWFDSLHNLTTLSLKNNRLTGEFPSSVRKMSSLGELILSSNDIEGKVPDLSGLTSLRVLNLSGNKLNSALPALPKGVAMAILSNNSFTGEIPDKFGKLKHFQYLDISSNELRGTLPGMLFSLPNLTYLNLASNMFSGILPNHVYCNSKLAFVDLSENRLRGSLPPCLSTASDNRIVKFNGNCLSVDEQHQHEEPYCLDFHDHEMKGSGAKNVGILVIVIVGIVILTGILGCGFLVLCTRYCSRSTSEQRLLHKTAQDNSAAGFSSDVLMNSMYISQAPKLNTQSLPACRSYSFEELKEASNNFDKSAFLGEGSYGKLYKGRLGNGMQVAIRCLPSSKGYSIRNLKLRLDLLGKLRHPHLVCLLGHCIDSMVDPSVGKVFLVYEYVPNGNFQDLMFGNDSAKVLKWSKRLAVLISVAKAVHFLHTGIIPGFFTNRLRTNNILLNHQGIAKLSDYGLSVVSGLIEKDGGDAEDPKSRQMKSLADDAYSFGYIILETVTGRSVSAGREAVVLHELASLNRQEDWQRLVDPVVLGTGSKESLLVAISISKKCISFESSRPSFEDILWNLQYAAQIQATADGEQVYNN